MKCMACIVFLHQEVEMLQIAVSALSCESGI